MEKYISQTNLEIIYKKEIKTVGRKGIEEKIKENRNEGQKSNSHRTIFLSHSHLDKTIVSKIGLLFEKLNVELYVDWLDKTLPEITDKQTANSIKTKIQQSHKFLFLATYHGLRSKWCNWELGIADSVKNNLAILPIQTKSGKWTGNEYLNLYPEMKMDFENAEKLAISDVSIHGIDGEILSLEMWLQQ